MRILIVEDEKRLAEALAQILKNEGYEVDWTGDGDSGLDYALSGIYDVIVLDIMLPKKKRLWSGEKPAPKQNRRAGADADRQRWNGW